MRLLILSVLTTFCLLGCTTPEQQAKKQQVEMDRMVTEFGPACSKFGYAMNTDAWRNCIVQLDAKNNAKQGGMSTSIFGSWGNWGRRGSGSSVGIGIGR